MAKKSSGAKTPAAVASSLRLDKTGHRPAATRPAKPSALLDEHLAKKLA